MIDSMRNLKTLLTLLFCCFTILFSQARTISNLYSGNWYDNSIWSGGSVPSVFDVVTITGGTTVYIYDEQIINNEKPRCDSLTINGFFDVGAVDFTVGGRELYTDYRAIRNSSCIINGRLRINGNVDKQFKVYGDMKFNSGSTFEMPAGKIMIDGAAYTPELSVPASKALLDVTDAASFVQGVSSLIILFNPHFFPGGLSIKGAKNFYGVSFGNNDNLPNFAARTTNDFLISETDQPIIKDIYLHYLPNPARQNKVVLNPNMVFETLQSDVGVLTVKSGRLKFTKAVLLSDKVPIECDIELVGVGEQKLGTANGSNNLVTIKGNLIINNPNKVQCFANIELQNGTVNFVQGKFDLTDKTISMTTPPTGFNANSYFITKNNYSANGSLLIKNLQGKTTFPVGTDNDYLPVILTSYGNDFSVSARPLIAYPNYGLFPINAQWDIKRTAGYSQAEIELQWVTNVENYNFSVFRRSAKVFRGEWGNWYPLGSQDWGYNEINANTFSKKVPFIDYFTTFTVLTETIIPVELKGFWAKKQANSDVLLSWETATEIDNAGFDVEKSTDGTDFSSMGFVKGAGNSVALNSYSFTDNNFVNTAYYRLKQMDNNGKTTYSKTVSVQKDNGKLALNVYPNLVTNQAEITVDLLNANDNLRELSVFDTHGRLVYTKNRIAKDAQSIKIPVEDLANGVYFIKVKIGQETLVSKFIKH
jgi:hypothetical protein